MIHIDSVLSMRYNKIKINFHKVNAPWKGWLTDLAVLWVVMAAAESNGSVRSLANVGSMFHHWIGDKRDAT